MRRWDASRLINVPGYHSKLHRHWLTRFSVTRGDAAETSTSSTTYETLLQTIYKSNPGTHTILMTLSHNVKNEGELASRGATFKIWQEREGGPGPATIVELRWTDALQDYKVMSVVLFDVVFGPGNVRFGVDWKVDLASYPCWSKNRFFTARSFEWGGDYLHDY